MPSPTTSRRSRSSRITRHAFNGMAHCALAVCDWAKTAAFAAELKTQILARRSVINPWMFLGLCDDLGAAARMREQLCAPPGAGAAAAALERQGLSPRQAADRLPVGRLSPARHREPDRGAVRAPRPRALRVLGVSFGPDDNSAMRARLVAAFDQFHDVTRGQRSRRRQAAARARGRHRGRPEGLHAGLRPGILALPAGADPGQLSRLSGHDGRRLHRLRHRRRDRAAVRPAGRSAAEKIVHLPDCYQVNDAQAPDRRARSPTRQESGPPGRTASCSAASTTTTRSRRPVFDIWMRLLARAAGSVLWLLRDNPRARGQSSPGGAARAASIPTAWCSRRDCQPADHLARHRLADLFLDTLPVNAHTTASDALWAGLPVLTCRGSAFAGRVAASLLECRRPARAGDRAPRAIRSAGAAARE